MTKPKTAIIGTGISGMGAAYLLHPHHDITVYEKEPRIGGHSRTIDLDIDDKTIPVDTGFIVFNKRNYPFLTALFDDLGVAYEKSDMSFGTSIGDGWLEYSSSNILAQKRNWIRPQFWRMIRDILKFNRCALRYLDKAADYTLAHCLDDLNMGAWFRDYYLKPMGAAIWSSSPGTIESFPAATFIRFFQNHGLLSINNRPQWYTVSGGSREYITHLTATFRDQIRLNTPVTSVQKDDQGWLVNGTDRYDHVIFACHADDTLEILGAACPAPIQAVLQNFTYHPNTAVVHRDPAFMPRRKKSWASWVYVSQKGANNKPSVSLTYWMYNLQNLKTTTPVLVTLNPDTPPDPTLVYDTHVFKHPVFSADAIQAQDKMNDIQGHDGLYFCGAYQRYGFHEDGLASAVHVAQKLGVTPPWL